MPWWLLAPASVALVLVAAKAHGRQVRLEREQQGVFEVDFRRQNPAVVEAIWRRDRWTLWSVVVALVAAHLLRFGIEADSLQALPIALASALALGFMVAGLSSWARMARKPEGPPAWRRRAMQGSIGWWLAVAAAAGLVGWTLA